jgi:trigger factor
MQFEMNIEEVSASRRRIHFTIASSEVDNALDTAYAELGRKIKMPGFRKGKVPRWLLEKKFSKNIESDVRQKLVDQGYRSADIPLPIVGQPSLEDLGNLSKGGGLNFTIGVDIRPKVKVNNYQGLEVSYDAPTVSDEELSSAVQARLRSKGRIEDADEDAIAGNDDFVLASFKLTEGEEVLVDEPGTMINMKADLFYPGVEELIRGMKKGDKKTAELTIGADSKFENLRGKTGEASLEIKGIQTYKIPDLSDEVAAELGF